MERGVHNVRQFTTTVIGGKVGKRNSGKPEATCILDVEGIRCVSVKSSIRNDIEGGKNEIWDG